jgi:hypothetical protein
MGDDARDDLAVETYLQVRVADGADALDVQAAAAAIPRYIGSFTVDTESVGDGEYFPFHVAVGFNGTAQEVDRAVEAIRSVEGVVDVRETRNRALRPRVPLPVAVEVELVVVEEIVVEIDEGEPPQA